MFSCQTIYSKKGKPSKKNWKPQLQLQILPSLSIPPYHLNFFLLILLFIYFYIYIEREREIQITPYVTLSNVVLSNIL